MKVSLLVEASIQVTIFNWKNINLYKVFFVIWMISSYRNAFFVQKGFSFGLRKFFFVVGNISGQYFWAFCARRKGSQGIWDFLILVMFTWALLVSCLPKEHFSQERHEEQRRGRICAAGGKVFWFVRWSQARLKCDVNQRIKLLLVVSSVLFRKAQKQPTENTVFAYLIWF